MNIHFSNEGLYSELVSATLETVVIGSVAYGVATRESDKDSVSIIASNDGLFNTHHMLQYVGDVDDEMFITLKQFINLIITGDQTVLYEASFNCTGELKWISDFANEGIFNSYKVVNAYLGFAKRDIKNIKKKYSANKLFHIYRGLAFADVMMNGGTLNEDIFKALKKYKEQKTMATEDIEFHIKLVSSKYDDLKAEILSRLENKEIPFVMSMDNMKRVENKYNEYIKSNTYNDKFKEIEYEELFYNAIENGVTY
jgi:predicted nucleotidyltransferase